MNEDARKHLEFTEQVIARMGNNSFSLKGWSVTLVAAIFALSTDKANTATVWVAVVPVIVFWILDAYFLGQERACRMLYNKLRKLSQAEWDGLGEHRYSLIPNDFGLNPEPLGALIMRPAIAALYGALLVCIVTFWAILRCFHA